MPLDISTTLSYALQWVISLLPIFAPILGLGIALNILRLIINGPTAQPQMKPPTQQELDARQAAYEASLIQERQREAERVQQRHAAHAQVNISKRRRKDNHLVSAMKILEYIRLRYACQNPARPAERQIRMDNSSAGIAVGNFDKRPPGGHCPSEVFDCFCTR